MKIAKRIILKLSRQKSSSPHIGALINAYTSAAILYSPLTFLGVATTVYGLWGAERIHAWIPWFNFGHLVLVLVLFMLVAMLFFYKLIIPSVIAFSVQQQYKHRNPLVADMQKLLMKSDESDKKLDIANKRLGRLEKMVKDIKGGER